MIDGKFALSNCGAGLKVEELKLTFRLFTASLACIISILRGHLV
jgi:hypothetical protein